MSSIDKQFQELVDKLIAAGFVAYWRTSPSGHHYCVAGTHQTIHGDIKCIQNAVGITNDSGWVVEITWHGQIGLKYPEKDFESMLNKAIELLNTRKQID